MRLESAKIYIIGVIALFFIMNASIHSQEQLIDIASRGSGWNWPVENPSGTKVAYIKFTPNEFNQMKDPVSQEFPPGSYWQNAKIIVCDADKFNNKVEICNIKANAHAGAMVLWVSDEKFICRTNDDGIAVWDINNPSVPETVYNNIDFNIEYALSILDYDENNHLILSGQGRYRTVNDRLANILVLNPFTGDTATVIEADAFLPWKDQLDFSDSPKDWIMFNKYFNPSGTLIWILLRVKSATDATLSQLYGFSCDLNGEDIVFFGKIKGHPDWWDDNTIFNSDDGKVYNRDGTYTGLHVSGHVSHTGLSPNRNFIAGETKCPKDPVELYVYKKYQTTPLATLFSTNFINVTWGYYGCLESHDYSFHVDPSFARTRKRLYYNKAYDSNTVGFFSYDFPEDGYIVADGSYRFRLASNQSESQISFDNVNGFGSWKYSDLTYNISNVSEFTYLNSGPWHNPVQGYSLPLAGDGNGMVYIVAGNKRYETTGNWDDVSGFSGWYYSDLTVYSNRAGDTLVSYLNKGPWHNQNSGYSLPITCDNQGFIYVASGRKRYEVTGNWVTVNGFSGWCYSDLTIYSDRGASTSLSYLDKGPWHNPDQGFTLPMVCDNHGKVYAATGMVRYENSNGWDDVVGFPGWHYSDLTIYSDYGTGMPVSFLNKGPWHNSSKGYSLPMDVDNDGNVYVATGDYQYQSDRFWKSVDGFPGWYFSDLTIYKNDGSKEIIPDGGPWHNPDKGYALPLTVDNNGIIFVSNGKVRLDKNLGWNEVNTEIITGFEGWFYTDVTVHYPDRILGSYNQGSSWYYLNSGPWHNPEKGYVLPILSSMNPELSTMIIEIDEGNDYAETFVLSNSYPNPFNHATTIKYDLIGDVHVEIQIFDVVGQSIKTLVNELKGAGNHSVRWNGTDEKGTIVTSGVYIYRIQAGDFINSKKMVLIR